MLTLLLSDVSLVNPALQKWGLLLPGAPGPRLTELNPSGL